MKKGFTLPEILITLTIIGIVATLTLPALNANITERRARTSLKKAINVLTNAGQLNMSNRNWSYDNVYDAGNNAIDLNAFKSMQNAQSLYGIIVKNLSIDMKKSGYGVSVAPSPGPIAAMNINTYFYLNDGSAIYFDRRINGSTTAAIQTDGLPLGYDIIYDMNGTQGPNILSNCLGTAAGAIDSVSTNLNNADGSDCNDPAKRIIKDQFLIRLRGTMAMPSGAMSNWLFND